MTDPRIDLPAEEAPASSEDAGRLIDLDTPPETPSTDPGATSVDLDKGQQPLPLWRVMHDAGDKHLELAPLTQHKDWHLHAAEIEALRDWLLPEEATPLAAVRSDLPFPMIERMDERQRLRQQLTEQARIAREGK